LSTTGTDQVVEGNIIGLTAAGKAAAPNATQGVRIDNSPNITVGSVGSAGNLISGNGLDGVLITGAASTNVVVQGNPIGTNGSGANLGNVHSAVSLTAGAHGNLIGTNGDGVNDGLERNVLVGSAYGVLIDGPGTDANKVAHNRIGTNVGGTVPIPNTT